MQTGLHRNTISKVYRQLETDGVVEAMAGSGTRDQQKPREIRSPMTMRNRGVTDIDRERANAWMDMNAGCTLQQTRDLLTRETDWRLCCGARVLVSTPGEHRRLDADRRRTGALPGRARGSGTDGGAGKRAGQRQQRHGGDEPLFLQRGRAGQETRGARPAVDFNDFRGELLKELRQGSCVGLVSISPASCALQK